MDAALATVTRELALRATRAELRALADAVQSGAASVSLDPAPEGGPYDLPLARVDIATVDRPTVRVSADPATGELLVTGTREKLGILAENLRVLASSPHAGDHLHVEYFPEHFYLDPESAALAVEALD